MVCGWYNIAKRQAWSSVTVPVTSLSPLFSSFRKTQSSSGSGLTCFADVRASPRLLKSWLTNLLTTTQVAAVFKWGLHSKVSANFGGPSISLEYFKIPSTPSNLYNIHHVIFQKESKKSSSILQNLQDSQTQPRLEIAPETWAPLW